MNRPFHLKALLISTFSSMALLSPHAAAGETDVDFSGFASFAYAKATTSSKEGKLHGIGNEGEYRDFNKLGLRMDADLQNKLTFTAQITAHGIDDYEPDVDWLFATYNFMPNLALSVGKVRVPLYMYSDYLDVGYAYQWISPPFSVYGVPSFSAMEGAKLSWTAEMGNDWNSEVLLWGGQTDESLDELNGENLLIEDGLGVAWSVEREWLTLRAVYFEGKTTADVSAQIAPLEAGLQAIEMGIQAITSNPAYSLDPVREDLDYNQEDSQFMGVGAFLDFEHTFFGAELTVINVDKTVALGELNSGYVMAGVRLPADWSLSLTYAVDRDKVNEEVYEQLEELTSPYVGYDPSGQLQQGVDQIIDGIKSTQINETDTWTIGTRWDFHRSASIKMEYLIQENSVFDAATAEDIVRDPRAYRVALDLVF